MSNTYTHVSEILRIFHQYRTSPESLESLQRGIRVHNAISNFLVDIHYPALDEKEQLYIESFKKWWNKQQYEAVLVEKQLEDDFLEVVGRVDCVVKCPTSKKLILLDFKTSMWADSRIWRLQGGWYHRLLTKNLYPMDNRMIFVQLLPTGDEAYEHVYLYNTELFDPMMNALKMSKYFTYAKKEIDLISSPGLSFDRFHEKTL